MIVASFYVIVSYMIAKIVKLFLHALVPKLITHWYTFRGPLLCLSEKKMLLLVILLTLVCPKDWKILDSFYLMILLPGEQKYIYVCVCTVTINSSSKTSAGQRKINTHS